MKKRHLIFALSVVGTVFTSCNDSFVNTKPLDQLSESVVWTDPNLAEAFVTELYGGLGNGGFDEQMLSSLTDEASFTHPGRGITTVTESRTNPADIGWINGTYSWQNMYTRIRACNLALENLKKATTFPTTLVERLNGEAKFMRAYYYHQLVRYYGAVPVVDRTFSLADTDFLSKRNTMEECINFIVKDLDESAALLNGKSLAAGRATRPAAMALKSRMLIYAASDLYDASAAKSKSVAMASYSNPEFMGYVSGDRASRWTKARDAAKAVLDLSGFGNQLNLSAPATKEDAIANYSNNSLAKSGGEKELIFARYFINAKAENGGRIGLFNGPNGYHNWAGNAPIQNFVDDYEMMDGSKFSWSNPTHSANPYDNRDPRFYASILYDGATWKPRTADVAAKDPVNQIQTGQYELTSGGSPYFGLDSRKSSVEDWNGSYTGYYFRKFTDPNPSIIDQSSWQQIPWPFLRYSEVLLNYAEACIELGQDAEARAWLNKIRFRSGMPALTESGDELRQRYRNERRVELAFEEQRFHDTRRWMIASTTLGNKVRIVNVFGKLKAGKSVSIYKYDPATFDYQYRVVDMDPGKENRSWSDKMYRMPIFRDEMNRNKNLIQNPGY